MLIENLLKKNKFKSLIYISNHQHISLLGFWFWGIELFFA